MTLEVLYLKFNQSFTLETMCSVVSLKIVIGSGTIPKNLSEVFNLIGWPMNQTNNTYTIRTLLSSMCLFSILTTYHPSIDFDKGKENIYNN